MSSNPYAVQKSEESGLSSAANKIRRWSFVLIGLGLVGLVASGICASRSFVFMLGDESDSVLSEELIAEIGFWSNLARIIGGVVLVLVVVGLCLSISDWLDRILKRPRG